jgi:methionyl-tRNA synthetase
MTRTLVTAALPYANGPIHFGHVAGAYLPADIYVRWKRLKRDEVLFICGTDEHGTPITLNAEKEGISPKAFVDKWHAVIKRAFDKLEIQFDNFSQTTRPHHYELSQKFFLELLENGYIFSETAPQLYCPKDKRGLPDRFVTGTCYKCGFERARGDECPKCGFNLDANLLIDPKCKTCGSPAEVRPSKQWFLDLPKLRPKLEAWLDTKREKWKSNVLGEVKKFLDGLKPRSITRDLDWGVPLPVNDSKGKVLYVWFDAPIGYISSTIEWAQKTGKPDAWKTWWHDTDNTRLIHFIGKDNISFHTVIWPSMLLGQTTRYVLPDEVPANEFYNLEGGKFSTSEGWFIDFDEFLGRYPADALRWTIARTAPEVKDSEFTWRDFQQKVNGELLGNFGNLGARVLKFVRDNYDSKIPIAEAPLGAPENDALAKAHGAFDELGRELERFSVRAGAERLLEIGGAGNKLLEQREPWKLLKTDPARAATAVNTAARILEMLAVALVPYVPRTAERLWGQLGLIGSPTDRAWSDAKDPPDPGGRAIGLVEHLAKKIEDDEVERGVAALKARAAAKAAATKEKTVSEQPTKPADAAKKPEAAPAAAGPKPDATFEDFQKLEIKIAKVLTAAAVSGADKLYQLELEVEGGAKRTVVSGIRPWYTVEQLVGRQVVYLANLAPKKIRGVVSQGMVLAGHGEDGSAVLLKPEKDVFPGSKVS